MGSKGAAVMALCLMLLWALGCSQKPTGGGQLSDYWSPVAFSYSLRCEFLLDGFFPIPFFPEIMIGQAYCACLYE